MFSKKKKNSDPDATANPVTPDPTETPDAGVPADEAGDIASAEESADAAETDVSEGSTDAIASGNEELLVLKDRYTRLMADFDNFRKRQVREREEWIKRANEDLLSDLLPVIDHLELALAQAADPKSPFVVGVQMVYDQFIALLDRYDMVPLDALGEPFDPTYHEALSQASSDTVPADVVMEQYRRGWLLKGRLLRPAQVIVSSGTAEPACAGDEPSDVTN